MITYIFIYSCILFISFLRIKFSKKTEFFVLLIFIIFFVGFRHEVGGDWIDYLKHFHYIQHSAFSFNNLLLWDPGYVSLEYLSKYFDLGIHGVNTFSAIIFSICFFYFIRTFNLNLFDTLLISFPYLILVVLNGYSRQGIAVGLAMAMIAAINKNEILKSIIFYSFAILFHKTAIILGVLYIFDKRNLQPKKWIVYILIFVITIIAYKLFQSKYETFLDAYIERQKQSSGAIIRILLNIVAGTVLLLLAKQWKKYYNDFTLWFGIFIFSTFVLFFSLITKATTVGDRILLYFYALQIVVFSRSIFILKNKYLKFIMFLSIILLYSLILIVWLKFAHHSFAWVPYKNVLIEVLK